MTRPIKGAGEVPRTIEDALDRLRAEGGRITRARRELVEFFFANPGGITADDLGAQFPTVDQATVYRNLASLESAGVVEHRHLGHGPATYHRTGGNSIPAVCDLCGHVVDVPRTEFARVATVLQRDYRFTIDLGHFAIGGRCSVCRNA
jgi:Fur family transcriptional regulator, ferric uptake regulator